MAILDIRGTHGSGKSWIPETLLNVFPYEEVVDEGEKRTPAKLGYHIPALGLGIVGPYTTSAHGGCDPVKDAEEIERRVQFFAWQFKHVMLEGILVAHTFGRYSQLAKKLEVYKYHFLFLNTPLKSCLARVRARRAKKENPKPFNPTNVTRDWHNIWGVVRPKFVGAGHSVIILDYRDPLPQILELIDATDEAKEAVSDYLLSQPAGEHKHPGPTTDPKENRRISDAAIRARATKEATEKARRSRSVKGTRR